MTGRPGESASEAGGLWVGSKQEPGPWLPPSRRCPGQTYGTSALTGRSRSGEEIKASPPLCLGLCDLGVTGFGI